jgi:hypothetical protein
MREGGGSTWTGGASVSSTKVRIRRGGGGAQPDPDNTGLVELKVCGTGMRLYVLFSEIIVV